MNYTKIGIRVVITLLIALVVACAPLPVKRPPRAAPGRSPFPPREELAGMASAPPPTSLFRTQVKELDAWELVGPLPDSVAFAAHTYDAPWAAALNQALAATPGAYLPSEAMFCAAREIGSFFLANEAYPGFGLKEFIVSRCGATHVPPAVQTLSAAVPDKMTDAKILEQWQKPIAELVSGGLGAPNRYVGMWFGRGHGRAVVIVASAERLASLESADRKPGAGGLLRLRGETSGPFDRLRALITRGAHEVRECRADPSVKLPAFAFECPAAADDRQAWIDLLGFVPGHVVGTPVMSLLAWPAGEAPKKFARPALEVGELPTTADALAAALVTALNGVRTQAGLKPLTQALAESKTATALAPHYWTAISGQTSPAIADKIAMGLQAGWDIEGVLQMSRFTAAAVSDATDVGQLLAAFLERPSNREALLAPAATQVAVGPIFAPDHRITAAVVSTYDFLDPKQRDALVTGLIDKINAERTQRGKPVAQALDIGDDVVAEAVAAAETGKLVPEDAMEEMIREAGNRLSGRPLAWISAGQTLADLKIPPELYEVPVLQLSVGLAFYREPGSPWIELVVFFLAKERDVGDGV